MGQFDRGDAVIRFDDSLGGATTKPPEGSSPAAIFFIRRGAVRRARCPLERGTHRRSHHRIY